MTIKGFMVANDSKGEQGTNEHMSEEFMRRELFYIIKY